MRRIFSDKRTAIVCGGTGQATGACPQSVGLGFWTNAIDSGQTSPGDAALDIMAGALNNTASQGLLDAQLVNNRLAATSFFTGQAGVYNATGGYAGQSAAASARAMLSTVGSSTDRATWQAAASASAASLLPRHCSVGRPA
ncbi:MAG TPA: hypothetical protein VF798_12330 [Burkholderiaceae bacterium]